MSIHRVLRRIVMEFTEHPSDVLLAAKMCAWAFVLPALKHLVPVKSLAAALRTSVRHTRRDCERERRIVTLARRAARLTRWNSGGNCLERGLIAYRYLCQAGANPVLVVGINRDGVGTVNGHAWVLVDGHPAGDSVETVASYTPVFAFSPDGTIQPSPPTLPPVISHVG